MFTINCALLYWRHLPARLLYYDFGKRALEIGREKGLMYINGFDHPNILAGQAQWTIWLKFIFFRTL